MSHFRWRPWMLALLGVSVVFSSPGWGNSQQSPLPPSADVLLSPAQFDRELAGHEGLILVPENRSAAHSRRIPIHFLRFPARKASGLPPVFFLPGGPGEPYSESRINKMIPEKGAYGIVSEMIEYSRTRDVILVNQRGNPDAPGLVSDSLLLFAEPEPLGQAFSVESAARNLRQGAREVYEKWTARGMDLAGYDIINMVDDVDALRRALGYETICLRGSSFGAQWALAYMKRWPNYVDRMILHGVEPVSHAYDSPQEIWETLERLEALYIAAVDTQLPEGGLLGAVKAILMRLEESPVVVPVTDPRSGKAVKVTVGADDFRQSLYNVRLGRSRRESLELWPKYILELYRGDYRYLASKAIGDRTYSYQGLMLGKLIDNSLGISEARHGELRHEPAARWLGDLNWRMEATREVSPTPVVSDAFRTATVSQIPVLMIQGDLDLSTPYQNAAELIRSFPNGHLIRVAGGTHGTVRDIAGTDASFPQYLYDFIAADFKSVSPADHFREVPSMVEMPALNFAVEGPSLFDAKQSKAAR